MIALLAVISCIWLIIEVKRQLKKVDIEVTFKNDEFVTYTTLYENIIDDSTNFQILIAKANTVTESNGYETKEILITYEYNIPKNSIINYKIIEVK